MADQHTLGHSVPYDGVEYVI